MPSPPDTPPLLRGHWMAGFEGADHLNMHGQPLDMVGIAGHAQSLDADYARVSGLGMRVVRESIGWRLAEPSGGGRFDFVRARAMASAAERHGVQVLWTLMHYGTPPDVSLLDDAFIARFADYAGAAARELRGSQELAPIYTPINEISYLAWAVCETSAIAPYIGDRADPRHVPMPDGFDVKRRLVRATLKAMEAIRAEDPRARFLHIDPIVHIVPPAEADAALVAESQRFREFQWQAWDMIAGRLEPDLGGSPGALDLVGLNHYVTAQWEFGSGDTLAWPTGDRRRLPLRRLLREAADRYQRPLLLAETGHVGDERAAWLHEVDAEVRAARRDGVAVLGVCLYPIVDRPDWNDTTDWHRCGLWDAAPGSADGLQASRAAGFQPGRHIDHAYAAALARCTRAPWPSVRPAPARAAEAACDAA